MSEKRKPHFDLGSIKASFSTPEKLRATGIAQRDSKAIGYSNEDIVRIIQSIEPRHFYKSMTANHNARAWQDVYHVPDGELVLYIKFTDNAGDEMALLSFKEK